MKKLLALLVVVIGLLGCADRNTLHYYVNTPSNNVSARKIDIYVDSEFGAADKVAIDDGIKQWNYALNGQIEMRVRSWDFKMEPSILKDPNAWFILKIKSDSKLLSGNVVPNQKIVLAFADKIGGHYIYMVRDRIWNEDVKGITMHELGHLLGSEHVGTHLMHDTYVRNKYVCVDYASAESVSKAQKLEMDSLNYCVFESGH